MVGAYLEGLDLHIQALEEWNENLSDIVDLDADDLQHAEDAVTRNSRQVEANKNKCLALCLIGNVSFINSVLESGLFRALCISFFDKNYDLPHEPLFIFNFLIEKFKPVVEPPDPYPSPVKRGEYLFKLLRFSSALLETTEHARESFPSIHKTLSQPLWCEIFDTRDRLWKCVDFSIPKYDRGNYKYNQAAQAFPTLSQTKPYPEKLSQFKFDEAPRHDDREIDVESDWRALYRGYLYVQRNNKVFIYANSNKPVARAIVVLPKYRYRVSRMLHVTEYPFESVKRLENLKNSFVNKRLGTPRTGKSQRCQEKNAFILSCNIGGIVSEITPKYLHKNLLYKRSGAFITWFTDCLKTLNESRIKYYTLKNPRTKQGGTAGNHVLPAGSIDILNANLLENVDTRFINSVVASFPIPTKKTHFVNHPLYTLKSQITKSYLIKTGSGPVGTFCDDLVYLKSDLEEVKTKFGWFKENRKIKPGSSPVKTDSFSRNKTIEYFTRDQTEPLEQDNIKDLDKFTVNLSGKRFVPEGSTYVRGRRYSVLESICHRKRIFFKRAFSSLQYEDGALRPNVDGVLVMTEDLDRLLAVYDEHIANDFGGELSEERAKSQRLWKGIFKTLINSPPVNRPKPTTTLRKDIDLHALSFLNQLI